jgi:hypothetical protein
LAGRRVFPPGILASSHPFLMGVHLGYYFFLNGLCPGLADTSKDFKLLIIAFYFSLNLGFHPYLVGFHCSWLASTHVRFIIPCIFVV